MAYLENFHTKPDLVKEHVKYLAITLDGRLNFDEHLSRTSSRVEWVATILGRHLLNVGGLNEGIYLYICVIRYMTIVGDSIWVQYISNSGTQCLQRRHMSITTARAFPTMRYEAARTLAGMYLFQLITEVNADVYLCVWDQRYAGCQLLMDISKIAISQIRLQHIPKAQKSGDKNY